MSKAKFSQQELAFFKEGDNLAETTPPAEDFSDLDGDREPVSGWVTRALAALSLVTAARS